MMTRTLFVLLPALAFTACGRDEPPKRQETSLGGQVGDSYRGMLDEARQGVGQANDQLQRMEQTVRERD